MGRKTQWETLAKIFVAFLETPVWKQKDLERRCEVGSRALRTCILDLQSAGVQIEREEDHPHVYYQVPKGWFPGGGTGLEKLDHMLIGRLVARLPRTATRERVLGHLVSAAFGRPVQPNAAGTDVDERVLDLLEDGAARSVALHMAYYTASRGESGLRHASVQRILYGTPTRFVAYCHRSARLKVFRADRITNVTLDSSVTYLRCSDGEVAELVAGSLDGFAGASVESCEFTVRGSAAHWVPRSLPAGALATTQPVEDGVRVSLRTTATEVLARFLTGLGEDVQRIEPESLRRRVNEIGRGAVVASGGARLNKHAARPIRSAG